MAETEGFEMLPGAKVSKKAGIAATDKDHETVKMLERAVSNIRGGRWQQALSFIGDAQQIICAEQQTFDR